jgi:Tol biopolymer transport system component
VTGRSGLLSATTVVLAASLVAASAFAMAVLLLLVAGSQKAEAAFPGRNGDIVFSGEEYWCALAAIVRVRPDGTHLRPLTCDPYLYDYASFPAWSADGKRIAFALNNDDEGQRDLWVIGANGKHRINITDTPNFEETHPTWFPSGRKIAYFSLRHGDGGESGLKVATLGEDGKVAKTTVLTSDGGAPAISPNGKRIAFVSHRDGDAEIYVMRTDAPEGPNNRPVKLTDNATYIDTDPDWSPDGKRIVYTSFRFNGNAEDTFIMRADGSEKKNLTRNPARDQHPVFSPDGKWIAFDSNRDGGHDDIWKMRIDGTDVTKVVSADEYESDRVGHPDWQPRP